MGVTDLSFRKRLGLELHSRHRANLAILHGLNYLMWECTLRCNLGCRHCGSDCRKSATQPDMPLADFLRVIDSVTPHVDPHKTMIVITGGEPLLRADLEQCGLELYRRGYPWGMVTNGLAMTGLRLKLLLAAGLRSVTVSLDGFEKTHNALRGNPESFAKAFRAVQLLAERSEELVFDVVTCVSPANFTELAAFKRMLIETGVKRWRIFTIFPIGRAAENEDLQLPPGDFKRLFDFIRQTRQEGHMQVSYGCEGFLGNYETDVRDGFFFCRAGIQVGSVLVDGSISACPNLRARFIQGNIYRDDFMEVWNTRYEPFRDRRWMKTGECAGCKHFRYCQGNGMHLRGEDGELLFCHLKRLQQGEKASTL